MLGVGVGAGVGVDDGDGDGVMAVGGADVGVVVGVPDGAGEVCVPGEGLLLYAECPFAGWIRLGVWTGPCWGASRPSTTRASATLPPIAPNARVTCLPGEVRSHSLLRRAASSGDSAARCAARELTRAAA